VELVLLNERSQFDRIIWRVNKVLLCAEVPLCRLNRGVPQEQLDLLKLATRSAAQLRAGAA
jgi:hypothetical protein